MACKDCGALQLVAGDSSSSTDPYEVVATIDSDAERGVVCRPRSVGNGGLNGQSSPYVFSGTLRPRGPFGWPTNMNGHSVRTFFTIPLNFTELRFPANPRDMASSDQSPLVQASPIRAGVLFGIEPWDYRKGRNLSPLPLRFLGGIEFISLSSLTSASYSPALVAGISLTAPIVDSSQFGSSLAAGLFYEGDLRGRDIDNYFVVTLGLNVFSLLAGN
jgi:hypothetical protein